ncbi:hypothetical protein P7C70_g3694, partial [Phenoliferia sp. Uapishka_3]
MLAREAPPSRSLLNDARGLADVYILKVRPIHQGVRRSLFSAILSKSLVSLVVAPRQCDPSIRWTRGLFLENDISTLATNGLRRLELDFWSPHTQPSSNELNALAALSITAPLQLTHLRVFANVTDTLLFRILKNSASLEVADVYCESVSARQGLVDAFRSAAKTLRSLRYTTNPTAQAIDSNLRPTTEQQPPFDTLFPRFEALEEVFVTASEISPRVFSLLGPTVRHLEVESLNERSEFFYSPSMMEDLRDPSLSVGLKSFRLLDEGGQWDESDVMDIRQVCRARGIAFEFIADEAEYEDDFDQSSCTDLRRSLTEMLSIFTAKERAKNAFDHLNGFHLQERYLVVLYHQATKLASKQDIARREQDVAAAKIKLGIVDE